ncbi:endonuclease/exonuclease/phosphatase family protein [[Eubacterium] cellulosolvens]
MKIATFNIEWMNDLFTKDKPLFKTKHIHKRYSGPSISDIPELCSRIQKTILQMDPDILGIVEGPKHSSQMEKFVKDYLSDQSGNSIYSVIESPSQQTQRPYLLVKNNNEINFRHLHDEPRYETLTKSWKFYPWGTYQEEEVKKHWFNRKPLVVEINYAEKKLTVILLHIKSKHIEKKDWKSDIYNSILARQKITSEIKKVRDYLDDALTEEMTRSIIVMGDLNDGPGRDQFEEQFMLQNLVDVIQGTLLNPEYNVYHVLETYYSNKGVYTLEFVEETGEKKRELLDHIMYSPGMLNGTAEFQYVRGSGKVEHEAWENNVGNNPDNVRDDRPSDHRPVSCEISSE